MREDLSHSGSDNELLARVATLLLARELFRVIANVNFPERGSIEAGRARHRDECRAQIAPDLNVQLYSGRRGRICRLACVMRDSSRTLPRCSTSFCEQSIRPAPNTSKDTDAV
jgi:hypothetical protein